MVHDLTIFHWDKGRGSMPSFEIKTGVFRFETCLRGMLIAINGGPVDWVAPGITHSPPTEVYRGADAYSWLLEVLSGLHSPLLGETEVLGQFREQVLFPLGPSVPLFLKGILEDVKLIRHECLQNLGQKTYGSLAKKLLSTDHPIYFLGAGQMTREIVPFMKKFSGKKVRVVARSIARAQRNLGSDCVIQTWSEEIPDSCFDLIVAAPVSDEELQIWIRSHSGRVNRCLDLRALPLHAPRSQWVTQDGFWNLQDFFHLQQEETAFAQGRVNEARQRIQQVTHKRCSLRWDRPFGWEDVCA